jgi:hypothetical protein
MFKKFVTFITLFCFLSTCFVRPALALDQLVVQKNAEGEFIIPSQCFNDLNMAEFELTHNGVKVGKLSTFLGKMTLEGVDKNSFYLSQVPKLTSLTVNLGGSATVDSLIETEESFSLITQGPSKLLKGFKVAKDATFGGAGVEVSGASSTENLKLKDLQVLTVQKGGSLTADLTQGEGPLKSLKILGEFKTKVSKSLEVDDTLGCTGSADMGSGDLKVKQIVNHGQLTFDKYKLTGTKLMNLGKLKFGQVTLDMTNTFNQKQIDVSNSLVVTGAWQNEKGATVNVNQFFEGRFSKYQDDGKTFVLGLASISAESGRITGEFLARYGMVEFMSDVLIPETASFQFEKFIRLHSHGNLKLNQGQNTFSLDNRKAWPALVLSPELREKIRPLAPGIFISAGKDLTRISNVTSTNTAIQLWCSGKYTGQGGITRAGFFDRNNVLITAKSAHLADEIRSYHGFTLQAKMAELLGKREVDGVLGLEVKQLHQDKEDTMKAGTLVAQVDQATLDGHIAYQKGMRVEVKEKMDTTDSFKLEAAKGALASIHGKAASVRLGGEFKDVALHTDVKTLRYAENIKGQLTSNDAFAETIIHEKKSQLHVEGLNKEVATKGIAVDKGAVVKAENNKLKAGSWIFNAGSIESANQYLADTALHLNMFGGKVKAHQATIFADVMNVNFSGTAYSLGLDNQNSLVHRALSYLSPDIMSLSCFQESRKDEDLLSQLSSISAKSTEINTALNVNFLGLVRGTDSLRINALVNANAGLFLSQHATINTLWNAPCYGATVYDVGGFMDPSSLLTGANLSSMVNTGIGLASGVATGSTLFWLKVAQFGWNSIGLVKGGLALWRADNKEDDQNYWRVSRIIKRTGDYTGFALQAYQSYKEYGDLEKLYNDTFPPQKKTTDNQQTTDNTQTTSQSQENNTVNPQTTSQPEENKPVEKPLDWSEFLQKKGEEIATYDNLKSTANSFLPGTLTVNAVWGGGNGVNIMPHIIERSVYHNGKNYNLAIDRTLKAHTGKDQSTTVAKSNTVLTSGDFEYGATVHGGQNFVHTGGNLTLTNGMNSKATNNHFKSDKKLTGEEGANAKGKSNVFESEDDLLFKGTSEAEKALFKSKNGKAAVAEEATLTIIPSKETEGPGVIVDGKTESRLGSKLNGEGDALVYTKDGHAQIEETARVDLKGDLTVVGKTADAAEGANIKVKHFHEKGETSATVNCTIQAESGPEAVTVVATKGEAKLDEKAKVTLVPSTESQETQPAAEQKEVPAPSDQTTPAAEKEKPKPRDIIVQGETSATIAGELNGKGNAIAYSSKGHAQLEGTARGSLEGELDVIGKTADGAEGATLQLNKMYVQGETSATLSSTLEVPDSPFAVFVIATAPGGKAEITDKAHIHVKPAEPQEQEKTEPETPLPNIVAKGEESAEFKPNVTGDARGYVETKGNADVKPNMDGISLEVIAKTGTLGGTIKLSQGKAGLITKGKWICDENIDLKVGKETAGPNEAEIDAKIAQAKAEALAEQPAPQEPEQTVQQSSEQKSSDTKDTDKELKEKLEENPNLLSRSQTAKQKNGDQKKEPKEINVKKHLKENPSLLSRSKKNRHSKESDAKKDDEKHKHHHHKKHRKHSHKSKGNDQTPDETAPPQPQSEEPSPQQQETTQPETPADVLTSETQTTEPRQEEEKAPQKPLSEMSVLSYGPIKLNGSIALENGMYQEDRPKEKKEGKEEKKKDTKEDNQDPITPEERGITYGSNLKLTGGGDLYANTAGAINKEAGSDIGMKNVYLHGDQGVHHEGKTLAEEDSVITSNGDIFEGETSVTKAGNSASFYAKGKMNKHKNARGNAIEFFRHGQQGGECAGALDAARLATFTNDQGKLTVKKSTKGDAANFVIGSFQKPKERPVAQEQLQTKSIVEAEEEKSGHKKKHSRNIYSRSKYPPKVEEARKQEKIGRDNPEKEEVEKPVSDLPPISEAGEVEIEKGASFKGKTMMLRGKGIEHLEQLFTQSGHFKEFDITDYLYVHTDQAVNFAESAKSASKSFEMHTSKVGVAPHVKLKAPEVFKLHSTDDDMTLGYDCKIKAGVYLELLSEKDIVGDFKKRIHRHADGTETVTFEGVTLEGGSGFKYDYIDPKTGLKEERHLGLRVDANGRVLATGMKVMAPSDIHVHGFDGIENKGVAQVYVKKVEEESNLWRDKRKVTYESKFFTPVAVSGGKLIMSSENGGLLWQAGGFGVADGADLIFNGHVKFLPLTGWHGHRTTRDTMITFADSENFSKHGLAQSSMFVNAGDATVRIWALNDHDIVAPGFNYSGEKGTLHLKGRWGYFSRVKLKHESHSSTARFDYDVSFFNHMKSFGVLKDAKSFVHNLAQENWSGAVQDAIKPSARVGISWTSSHRKWETLGSGSMSTKDMIVDFSKGMIFDNAYSLSCTGVFTPVKLPYWLIRGANLHSSYSTDTYGIYAGLSTNGPSIGANGGHTEGKSNTWVPGNVFIAKFNGDAGKIKLDAANMHIGKLNGSIHEIIAKAHKDRSQSKGFNMSLDWSFAGPIASASAHFHTKAQANQVSGLHVDEVGEKGRIGHAELIGAKITGIEPESQTYKPLSKDYDVGGQIGFTAGKSGPQNLMVGFSKDGKQILLNLNVAATGDKGKEEDDPWRQIGTITVNGVNLPIITQINEQFFKDFGSDLKQLNNKIFGTVQQAVTEYVPPAQVHTQEAWIPLEDEVLEDEVVPTDLPLQQEPAVVAQMEPVDEPKMVEVPAPKPVQDDTSNPLTYRPEVIRAVEQILQTTPAVKPSSFVPFVDSGIEILEQPFLFEGTEYRYRVRGTNFFMENPKHYGSIKEIMDANSIHPSTYVQKSNAASRQPGVAAFFRDIENIDGYKAGQAFPKNSILEGLVLGERKLNGHYAAIAANNTDPLSGLKHTFTHEFAHIYDFLSGREFPGHVPGNSLLTKQNIKEFCGCYADDWRNLLRLPDESITDNAQRLLRPWDYFETNFRNSLLLHGIKMPEESIAKLVDLAMEDLLLHGNLPSARYSEMITGALSKGNLSEETLQSLRKANVLQKAAEFGEELLVTEIRTALTEMELDAPGIAKELAPNVDEFIQNWDAVNGYKFDTPATPHDVIPAKQNWLAKARGIYEKAKEGGQFILHNKHTPKGLVFLDWVLHMGVEKFANGSDWPTAVVEGTKRMGVDAAIYGPIYYGIGSVAGGPVALGVACVGVIAEFVPEVTEDEIARVHNDLRDIRKKPFSFSNYGQMETARAELEILTQMQTANMIKAGNAQLQKLGDWMVDQIYIMDLVIGQAQLNEYDMITDQWNSKPLPKKTHEQIQQEIEDYRQSKRLKQKNKDKEEF